MRGYVIWRVKHFNDTYTREHTHTHTRTECHGGSCENEYTRLFSKEALRKISTGYSLIHQLDVEMDS